ncbi:MAG: DUF2334 domain-containing protein [Desulfosporosinus sp.]|nr:DUF2334 domain-containing protein [Desulfosporosinus sp.]
MKFHVLFRLDDICQRMDYEKFKRFQDIFDRYDVKPIIGVVPDNHDDNLNPCEALPGFWDLMRRLKNQGWVVAMHGHTHVYSTKESGIFNRGEKSEFSGLPYDQQLEKLQKGLEILRGQGLETDLFMAPSNSVDENTMRALKVCGFRYLTIGSTDAPYEWYGLTILPSRDAKPGRLCELATVMLHPNTTPERIFVLTEKFLEKNRRFVIDFPSACQLPKLSRAKALRQEKKYRNMQKVVELIYPIYKNMREIAYNAKRTLSTRK